MQCFGEDQAGPCLCRDGSGWWKGEGWTGGSWFGRDLLSTVQVRGDDDLDQGSDGAKKPRCDQTWKSIGWRATEVTRRAARFPVWGQIGGLQVIETQKDSLLAQGIFPQAKSEGQPFSGTAGSEPVRVPRTQISPSFSAAASFGSEIVAQSPPVCSLYPERPWPPTQQSHVTSDSRAWLLPLGTGTMPRKGGARL